MDQTLDKDNFEIYTGKPLENFRRNRLFEKLFGKLQYNILDFILALLGQEMDNNDYISPLISGLALLGIDSNSDSWLSPILYTGKLSAIITVSRFLVVYKAYITRIYEIHQYETTEQLNILLAEKKALSIFENTKKLTSSYLLITEFGSKPKPFNWLIKLRSYGLKIQANFYTDGTIKWNENEINFANISFSIFQLRGFTNGLINSVENRLLSELLLVENRSNPDLPLISLNILKDNINENRPDWFFLLDIRNSDYIPDSDWLYNRIFDKSGLLSEFINMKASINEKAVWNLNRLSRFFRNISEFKKELLVLFYILKGGPPRSPELLSIRYKNSIIGGPRNLFFENGFFTFSTGYYKNYNKSANLKIIHRFLPKEASRILLYYFWLVQPFKEKIQILLRRNTLFSPFL